MNKVVYIERARKNRKLRKKLSVQASGSSYPEIQMSIGYERDYSKWRIT
jgi:hypothetical protein